MVDNIARGIASRALKQGLPTDEQVDGAVSEYLTENPPIAGATQAQVNQINSNTQKIKELVSVLKDGNVRLTY
jgi:hypothetical protein